LSDKTFQAYNTLIEKFISRSYVE